MEIQAQVTGRGSDDAGQERTGSSGDHALLSLRLPLCAARLPLGEDHVTGDSYEHRKAWIVERLRELSNVFAIDVCAYAVMSNHYHVVLRLDVDRAHSWTSREVVERWAMLFKLPPLAAEFHRGEALTDVEWRELEPQIELWRQRLADLSWYMRSLNEHIARKANHEDNCTGRFWEGRFKSQPLLDEIAVLSLMTYVDLNPIRAGLADTPENSDFTAIQQRIHEWKSGKPDETRKTEANDWPAHCPLLAFRGAEHEDQPDGIPCGFIDYLELVDWTGRAVREDKRGAIPANIPPILERLNIDPAEWVRLMKRRRLMRATVLGRVQAIQHLAEDLGRRFLLGANVFRRLHVATN